MSQPVPSAFLLKKYLHDQCTDPEKELVENWYASLHNKTDYLDSLSESEQNRLQEETYDYIKTQVYAKERRTLPFSPAFAWLTGIAAALIMGFGVYFLYQPSQDWFQTAGPESAKITLPDTIRFENEEARMVMHKLPDGSSVWMHANAVITYPRIFEKNKRKVTFTGEGFFDITPDKKRPFLIQSGEMKIQVLGTRFNVKAAQKQKILEVSVVSGSVSVTAPGMQSTQQIILKPQQKAFFETKSKRLTFVEIPVEHKKEIFEPVTIVFEETPLRSVITQLEQRFETHIHLVNPDMYNCKLTADFEQQSMPVILEMLCTSLEASYTMSGNTILIEGTACK
jgi:transmembrane sensor